MMTIDDAIKHEEERAADLESTCTLWKSLSDTKGLTLPSDYEFYKSDAEDHRQVAAWLKELKALKEESKGDLISRDDLKHRFAQITYIRFTADMGQGGFEMFSEKEIEDIINKAPSVEVIPKELIRKEDVIHLLERWSDGYSYIEIPTDTAIEAIKEMGDGAE